MKTKTLIILTLLSPLIFCQWTRVSVIPEMTNVPSFYLEGENIYAGGDSIIYLSTNEGESWNISNRISAGVDFVSAITKYGNRIFAGTYNYGVFESTDNGTTWFPRNNGLNGPGAKTISDFVIRENKLYASTIGSGIFVFDLGNNTGWQSFNNGIPAGLSNNVNSLTIKDGIIYAGAGGNGYYYTNQSGSNEWIEHQFGMLISEPLTFFDLLLIDQNQFIVSSYGLYKSTDNGKSWKFINTGTGYLSAGNFINTGTEIFVAMTKASRTIWLKSTDNGFTWNLWNEVLGGITLNTIYTDGKILDGRLNGLWYYQLVPNNVDDDDNRPDDFILNQNYPNPFNPGTVISYRLPVSSEVTLKVYNVLGREITTLVNKQLPAGVYEVEFNAASHSGEVRNLPSGIYFYQLLVTALQSKDGKAVTFSETKKMTLIK